MTRRRGASARKALQLCDLDPGDVVLVRSISDGCEYPVRVTLRQKGAWMCRMVLAGDTEVVETSRPFFIEDGSVELLCRVLDKTWYHSRWVDRDSVSDPLGGS